MTVLFNEKINLTEDATRFINEYIDYVKELNHKDLFEGLKDKQILKNKFIFKMYQLENLDSAMVDIHVANNRVYVLASVWTSKVITIGSIPLTPKLKLALSNNYYPKLSITGGFFKQVVPDDFDKDKIVDGFDPYQLTLEIHKADMTVYKSQKIDSVYHAAFKTENSLITVSKNLMRCFAVFGLLLGLGFMFLGYMLTGLLVIIAFFGVNSYTLIIADTHMQTQPQRQRIS
ncbi:hypothetical protein [Companilactobacillus farciminis]|uniref:hypothetical protein n=1 Tax=Companilactobacillus farciminis TaxID=1612 RepID=UPI00232C55F8|nr:hypothetical protein [Companilactobacillus farciminis]WCG34832.1 hypothetical protein PML84_08135 [Companilactobacillus farciminis]